MPDKEALARSNFRSLDNRKSLNETKVKKDFEKHMETYLKMDPAQKTVKDIKKDLKNGFFKIKD